MGDPVEDTNAADVDPSQHVSNNQDDKPEEIVRVNSNTSNHADKKVGNHQSSHHRHQHHHKHHNHHHHHHHRHHHSRGQSRYQSTSRKTTYDRVNRNLSNETINREITLGKRISYYKLRSELGNGNFSQVKLGIHDLTNDRVAVKILDKTKLDDKTRKLLACEVDAMDKLHHPNIIRLYEVVETIEKLYLMIEYAPGGELYTCISEKGRMKEGDAKPLFAQIVSALDHIHTNGIVHRDVKAENILFASNRQVKVADFGFSTFASATTKLNTFCGSPPYAAPELFKDDYYYGPYVDLWALGVLLYFMVVGTMPFRAETLDKLKDTILEGRYAFPSFISENCKILVTNILRRNPRERYTINEIRDSTFLDHSVFPDPYPSCQYTPLFNTNDDHNQSNMTEFEKNANQQISELGITQEMYDKCERKDYRCSITGTYRIILFSLQRRQFIQDNDNLSTDNKRSSRTSGGTSSLRSSVSVFSSLVPTNIFNRNKVSVASTTGDPNETKKVSINTYNNTSKNNNGISNLTNNINGGGGKQNRVVPIGAKKPPISSRFCTIL